VSGNTWVCKGGCAAPEQRHRWSLYITGGFHEAWHWCLQTGDRLDPVCGETWGYNTQAVYARAGSDQREEDGGGDPGGPEHTLGRRVCAKCLAVANPALPAEGWHPVAPETVLGVDIGVDPLESAVAAERAARMAAVREGLAAGDGRRAAGAAVQRFLNEKVEATRVRFAEAGTDLRPLLSDLVDADALTNRWGEPVASRDALRGVRGEGRELRHVESPEEEWSNLWRWDAESAAPEGPDVVAPDAGPGRWCRLVFDGGEIAIRCPGCGGAGAIGVAPGPHGEPLELTCEICEGRATLTETEVAALFEELVVKRRRLQVDPGGSDLVDELEQALAFARARPPEDEESMAIIREAAARLQVRNAEEAAGILLPLPMLTERSPGEMNLTEARGEVARLRALLAAGPADGFLLSLVYAERDDARAALRIAARAGDLGAREWFERVGIDWAVDPGGSPAARRAEPALGCSRCHELLAAAEDMRACADVYHAALTALERADLFAAYRARRLRWFGVARLGGFAQREAPASWLEGPPPRASWVAWERQDNDGLVAGDDHPLVCLGEWDGAGTLYSTRGIYEGWPVMRLRGGGTRPARYIELRIEESPETDEFPDDDEAPWVEGESIADLCSLCDGSGVLPVAPAGITCTACCGTGKREATNDGYDGD